MLWVQFGAKCSYPDLDAGTLSKSFKKSFNMSFNTYHFLILILLLAVLCVMFWHFPALRYTHFWRRYTEKWKSVMGFASISDQLACDNCLEFKAAFKDATETWSCLLPICCCMVQLCWIKRIIVKNMTICLFVLRMCKANTTPFGSTSPTLMVWRRTGPSRLSTWRLVCEGNSGEEVRKVIGLSVTNKDMQNMCQHSALP